MFWNKNKKQINKHETNIDIAAIIKMKVEEFIFTNGQIKRRIDSKQEKE